MQQLTLTLTVTAALAAVTFTSAANADVLVSNLSEAQIGGVSVGQLNGVTFMQRANAFTTGSAAAGYTLNSATLKMSNASGDPSDFSLELFSESSGNPGSSLAALSGSSDPATAGDFTYTATGVTLLPNTTYFLVADAANSGPNVSDFYSWGQTLSTAQTTTDGWTVADVSRFSPNDGATWSAGNSVLLFSIDATGVPAIPEPTSLALLSLGGLALVRRRRGV